MYPGCIVGVRDQNALGYCPKHLEAEQRALDASLARADAALKRLEKREQRA